MDSMEGLKGYECAREHRKTEIQGKISGKIVKARTRN